MTDKLKPCPFCGKVPRLEQYGDFWQIECRNDECWMKPRTSLDGKDVVIRGWERRNGDDRT